MSVPMCCPSEAQVRARLEIARTWAMSHVERVICEDAFRFAQDRVADGDFTWHDVMYDTSYVVAQIFDDYFMRMGLDADGCDPREHGNYG